MINTPAERYGPALKPSPAVRIPADSPESPAGVQSNHVGNKLKPNDEPAINASAKNAATGGFKRH